MYIYIDKYIVLIRRKILPSRRRWASPPPTSANPDFTYCDAPNIYSQTSTYVKLDTTHLSVPHIQRALRYVSATTIADPPK